MGRCIAVAPGPAATRLATFFDPGWCYRVLYSVLLTCDDTLNEDKYVNDLENGVVMESNEQNTEAVHTQSPHFDSLL